MPLVSWSVGLASFWQVCWMCLLFMWYGGLEQSFGFLRSFSSVRVSFHYPNPLSGPSRFASVLATFESNNTGTLGIYTTCKTNAPMKQPSDLDLGGKDLPR